MRSDDFTVPVLVQIPRGIYRQIATAARAHDVDVQPLVVEAIRRGIAAPAPIPPTRKWTPADDARLRALHAEGLSGPKIGALMGRTNSSVGHRRDFLGLTAHGNGRPRKAAS